MSLTVKVVVFSCQVMSPTLCDPMDCSRQGSSVQGISKTRMLEWVAIAFSRGSPRPRDGNRVSYIGRCILCYRATWEAHGKIN